MAGRPERSVDPDAGPVQRLAYALRKLRVEAGSPIYREMARLTGCGASTLSQAAGGERLPSLPTLRAYVQACGGDAAEWERQWHEAAVREAAGERPAEADAAPPYKGLRRFEARDRELFFGRDELVARLAEQLGEHRLVAVVGASGSGKSSLLRAGLLPALRSGQWPGARPAAVRVLTPGPRPAAAAALLAPGQDDGETVVVIDQFEELFTLGAGAGERAGFLDLLVAVTRPGGGVRAVIAMRADFFGRCAEHPGLAEALRDATLLVAPMGPAALREVVVRPAAAAGLVVERSLTARIVHEAEKEPGSLPLVSHALLETWRRRRGRVLTEQMYDAAGGIRGAIAATAEDVYGRLSPSQAGAARHILLRLITPGEGAQDTRRTAGRAELGADSPETAAVLELLLRARLLTSDGESVDLAHEAVISAWPRLRAWVEEDRERLRLHRRLTEAAGAWEGLDRDPGALYRGSRLAAALDAFGAAGREALSGPEAAFLDAAAAARAQETRAAARGARRLRLLTAALSLLLVLAVTAGTVAWRQSRASDTARQTADTARRSAVAAQQVTLSRQLAAQSEALMSTDTELAMLLAVQAYRAGPTTEAGAALYRAAAVPLRRRIAGGVLPVRTLAFSHDGRTLAWADDDGIVLRAGVDAGRATTVRTGADVPSWLGDRKSVEIAFSRDDRTLISAYTNAQVVRTELASGRTRRVLAGRTPQDRSFSDGSWLDADGGTMVTYGPGERDGISAWDTATGRSRVTAAGWRDLVGVSPDGQVVAAYGTRGLGLWDTATGRRLATATQDGNVTAFSGDGRTLALSDSDGVRLWRWAAGQSPTAVVTGARNSNETGAEVALSHDGGLLATGSPDGTVELWDTATGRGQTLLTDYTGTITALAFSDDGRTLAAGSDDGTVRVFGTGGVAPARLENARSSGAQATGVAYAEQGRTLAVGQTDGTVQLWDAGSLRRAGTLRSPDRTALMGPMLSAPAARNLADLGDDGTLRIWDASTRRGHDLEPGVVSAALSPDGRTVVAEVVKEIGRDSEGPVNEIHVWDTASGASRPVRYPTPGGFLVHVVAVSPDGRTVALRTGNGTVTLLATATGRIVRTLEMTDKATELPTRPDRRPQSAVSVAFSPDGRVLAATGDDGTTSLWDVATGRQRAALSAGTSPGTAVAFSADGRTLAVADAAGTLRLWDVATGQVRAALDTGTASLVSVEFSPDATALTGFDGGGAVLVWKVALPRPAAAISAVCAAVDRAPTPQETARYLPRQALPPACPPAAAGARRR